MKPKIIRTHATTFKTNLKQYINGEWLVTNALGGYSSSTILGMMTRKYHALLVASLAEPLGRFIMLNHLTEEVIVGEKSFLLNCEEKPDGSLNVEALNYLKGFFLEEGLPVWHYLVEGVLLEKRIYMPHLQNTVYITYTILEGAEKVRIKLYPCLHFRPHEADVNLPIDEPYSIKVVDEVYEISLPHFPSLRLSAQSEENEQFTIAPTYLKNIFFRVEMWRGYESIGHLWNPGFFELKIKRGAPSALIASTESVSAIKALSPLEANQAEMVRRSLLLQKTTPSPPLIQELILAADQFVIYPKGRVEDSVRAGAMGEELCSIIAGYHWFTDWGRDTMISLEGLCLSTGRFQEARWILKTFSHYVKQGLIPNMFPEGEKEGIYNTADATLWFFHAIDRYFSYTMDPLILDELLPILEEIVQYHLKGTLFGIHVDEKDQLLTQGQEGYQLTWMDAKVGDWVVTPRRGKCVELNALWYNALKLMEEWVPENKKLFYKTHAEETFNSFNRRFWNQEKGYLYDVVDGEKGDDSACRPNQVFAISLKYPVLEKKRWDSVMKVVEEKLLTPFGLRTLSPEHPDFKRDYEGDLRSRDAAYHQGTVWPWLIGPFIDAWLKLYPDDKKRAREFLHHLVEHLSDAGIGTINEIFDATEPYAAKGCMAQAWSVAEVLRSYLITRD